MSNLSVRGPCLVALMAGFALAAPASAQIYQNPNAQDSPPPAAAPVEAPSDAPIPRVVKKHPPKPVRKKAAQAEAAKPAPVKPIPAGANATSETPVSTPVKPVAANPVAATQMAAATTPAAAQPGKPTGPDIAAKLSQAGAGACAPQLNAAATQVMGKVATFNTMSNWAKSAVDKRLVSVTIGQKYSSRTLPYGATSIVASPNPMGSCDTVAVQILPSHLPCAKLRESLASTGKAVGDLVDIAVMQDENGDETLLVPTASKTCVMVVVKTAFPK